MADMQYYDVAVLGGGPGGYVAAIRAARRGKKTVLIEARELGGTCLNRGCVPTKALLHGAEQYAQAQAALEKGVLHGKVELDYGAVAAEKDRIVARLRKGVAMLERSSGVSVVEGFGRLTDPRTILVGSGRIRAEQIILATGSYPARPPIPGIDGARIWTSDEALTQKVCPSSMVVVGGGVIGIEFATLYASLGIKVTVLEMADGILPGIAADLADVTRKHLAARGVEIYTGAQVRSLESRTSSVCVRYGKDGKEMTAEGEYCLVCIGRKPATKDLGLEACGVVLERGYVRTDEHMRTSVPHIYAIGDITGKNQLAHVASAQALVAADNCAGIGRTMRYDCVPACVYASPEIACVGLSAAEAEKRGHTVKTGRFDLAGNGRAMIMGETDGRIELVTDARTGEILGAQMLAPRATDMIAEIAAVMRAEGTVEELQNTIHPHPTVSESIFEAVLDVDGLSCHKAK